MMAVEDGVGPDFICIGAQKGGTRWLFDQLDGHADFSMPTVKELVYLNTEIGRSERAARLERWQKRLSVWQERREHGHEPVDPARQANMEFIEALVWLHAQPFNLDLYAKLFNRKGDLLSGDVTPGYAIVRTARAREVLERFPRARILYIARDPIARLWSQYCMVVRTQRLDDPHAMSTFERFLTDTSGIRHSSIRANVARWRRPGSEERFRLFFFDDILSDPAGLRTRVLTFLGADPEKPSHIQPGFNRKSNDPKIDMPPAVRDRLIAEFADEIRSCAAEFEGPAAEWPRKYGL